MSQKARPAPILIRAFVAADYARVLEIWSESGLPVKPRGRDSRANIEKQVRMSNVRLFVAETAGRTAGTVLATHDGRKGWINRLAVDACARRRGIGRRLILEAEQWLAAAGMEIFACLIESDNLPSMEIFEGLGYTRHPEIVYFAKRTYPDV